MTLKNSLWTNRVENHKRRIGVIAICALVQIVYFPLYLLMYYSRINARNLAGQYEDSAYYQLMLQEATEDALTFNVLYIFVILLLAMLIGIQGYSYLYSRKKMDLYMSVPVDSKKRFWLIYSNGISYFAVPLLIGVTFAVLIAWSQNALTGAILGKILISVIYELIFFFAAYHTVLFAVMLTGNMMVTIVLTAVIFFSMEVVAILYESYCNLFFHTFTNYLTESYLGYGFTIWYLNGIDLVEQYYTVAGTIKAILEPACYIAVGAIILLIGSVICYKKRVAEAAGKAVAFRMGERIIKMAAVIGVGLAAASIMYQLSEYNEILMVVALLGCGTLTAMAMEVLFAYDVKAVFRHAFSSILGIIISCCIMAFFYFDLSGFDTYVPEADKIESYALLIDDTVDYSDVIKKDDSDNKYTYQDRSTYAKKNMFLTDAEAIVKLAQKSIARTDVESGEYQPEKDDNDVYTCTVLYRLKSGREVSRRMYVDTEDETNISYLDRILSQDTYLSGLLQVMDEESRTEIPVNRIYYQVQYRTISTIPVTELEHIYSLWQKDAVSSYDYTMLMNQKEVGRISMELPHGACWYLPVYEHYDNLLSYLKKNGYYVPMVPDASDIQSITVVNYNQHIYDTEEWKNGIYDSDPMVSVEYTDEEQIAEIQKALYPNELNYSHYKRDKILNDISVVITLKPDADYTAEQLYQGDYGVYESLIPSYVLQDTAFYFPE